MTWGLDGEDLVMNFGDLRTMDRKGCPPFFGLMGQTTILEDAEVV
jgi:hypothetical protein